MSDLQTKFDAVLGKKGQDYFAEFSDFGQALVDAQTAIGDSIVDVLTATSVSTAQITTGTQSIIATLGKAFDVGSPIVVTHDANNLMYATVGSYNAASGALSFTVPNLSGYTLGSGTYSGANAWTITPGGNPGAPGADYWNTETTVSTGTATPISKDVLLCRTSTGAITVTLPGSGRVQIGDVDGSAATNNITVTPPSGHSIMDGAANETFVIDRPFFAAIFRNRPGSTNWSVE